MQINMSAKYTLLLKKLRIHNNFQISLLEQNNTMKNRMNKTTFQQRFKNNGNCKKNTF